MLPKVETEPIQAPDTETVSDGAPQLTFLEYQAVTLVWRLATVLSRARLSRVAWLFVLRALEMIGERVAETLREFENASSPPNTTVPLTGSIPLIEGVLDLKPEPRSTGKELVRVRQA